MKKIGSFEFFENIDLNLKFDFNDLMKHFKADSLGIKKNLLDENKNIKMDKLEQFVEAYVNQKIKDKLGKDFSLDVMDETMDISWDIEVKSVKKKNIETWWGKNMKLPNLKKV